MAAYAVIDYVTAPQGTIVECTALLETKLETLDSTTNPIRLIGIEKIGSLFVGYLIYDGA